MTPDTRTDLFLRLVNLSDEAFRFVNWAVHGGAYLRNDEQQTVPVFQDMGFSQSDWDELTTLVAGAKQCRDHAETSISKTDRIMEVSNKRTSRMKRESFATPVANLMNKGMSA